ncbi:hypothetical protein ACHAWF_011621, partial [Thalassiosira exigua]
MVLDLESSEECGGTSLSISDEVQFALHLFNNLKSGTNAFSTDQLSCGCCVTAMTDVSRSLGADYERFVEVSSADAFQGRKSSIVIF